MPSHINPKDYHEKASDGQPNKESLRQIGEAVAKGGRISDQDWGNMTTQQRSEINNIAGTSKKN